MWQRISLKGVIIGAVTDVVGTNIWGLIAIVYIFSVYHVHQGAELTDALKNDPVISILNWIIGGGFTVLGGYFAAHIAKHDELTNGTLASFLCVLFAFLEIGSTSILWVIIGVVVNPILGFLGGYLRAWQKRKQNIPAPPNEPQQYPISETTRRIIDQMLAHGFRQGEQYKTEFAFFGDATALDRIRDYFLSNGYEQDKAQTDEMLIVVRPVTLTYDSIGKALHDVQNLAREYAVTFDGWSVDARQIH